VRVGRGFYTYLALEDELEGPYLRRELMLLVP
jgi:hypothetical protein